MKLIKFISKHRFFGQIDISIPLTFITFSITVGSFFSDLLFMLVWKVDILIISWFSLLVIYATHFSCFCCLMFSFCYLVNLFVIMRPMPIYKMWCKTFKIRSFEAIFNSWSEKIGWDQMNFLVCGKILAFHLHLLGPFLDAYFLHEFQLFIWGAMHIHSHTCYNSGIFSNINTQVTSWVYVYVFKILMIIIRIFKKWIHFATNWKEKIYQAAHTCCWKYTVFLIYDI